VRIFYKSSILQLLIPILAIGQTAQELVTLRSLPLNKVSTVCRIYADLLRSGDEQREWALNENVANAYTGSIFVSSANRVLINFTVWTTCPYYARDGLFNPDGRTVNNIGDFDSMANAVLFNSLAWAIAGDSVYSTRVATYIKTWFLDTDTFMNPNLNYAQMQRGPTGQQGTHTGILSVSYRWAMGAYSHHS
jgi:hypothetical protein